MCTFSLLKEQRNKILGTNNFPLMTKINIKTKENNENNNINCN